VVFNNQIIDGVRALKDPFNGPQALAIDRATDCSPMLSSTVSVRPVEMKKFVVDARFAKSLNQNRRFLKSL